MGYWIGKPYWNHGYCTEAAQTLLRYAFDVLHLNRVQARHMTKNPTSGRVMQKAGMQYEGTLRQSLRRWGAYEDAAVYAALRTEYTEENMSTEQNKAIVHRAFDELFNQRHAEVIDELWAKEFIHTPGQQGLDTWKEGMVSTLAVAPPDLHLAIEDMIAEGDKVVVRFTWSFTHTVPFFGAEPTGKYISWTGISINRLRDGKIVEEWANLDSLGLERQLGRIA